MMQHALICSFLMLAKGAEIVLIKDVLEPRAPGASATYSANFSRSSAVVETVQWRLNEICLSQATLFDSACSVSSCPVTNDRASQTYTSYGDICMLTITISPLLLNDSGDQVDIYQTVPIPSSKVVANFTTLTVTACSSQEPAEPDNSTSCTYNYFNCPTLFTCPNSYDEIYATCLANATWNDTITCTQDGSNGLSTGAKVGIGIVTCAGVAGLVIVGVLIYKKKNEGYIGGNAD